MACECITKINEHLAADERASNTRIETAHIWRSDGPPYSAVRIAVEKRTRSRQRLIPVFPTFCPFCGVRYVEEQATS